MEMESINLTSKEIQATMWSAARILFAMILLWKLPALISVLCNMTSVSDPWIRHCIGIATLVCAVAIGIPARIGVSKCNKACSIDVSV